MNFKRNFSQQKLEIPNQNYNNPSIYHEQIAQGYQIQFKIIKY